MRAVQFCKYHALENDFLVIEKTPTRGYATISDIVQALCHRHTGVGADGVIMYEIKNARISMRIFNADGSEAEISGNGMRILAHHLYRTRIVAKKVFEIHTKAGKSSVKIVSSRSSQFVSRIELAKPRFACRDIPMNSTEEYFIQQPFATKSGKLIGTAVNVGNPHVVFFVDNFNFDWRTFGGEVEIAPRFPQQTNVEFAVIESRRQVTHCSWERGVGMTRASGTGAASTVAAGIINGLLDHQVSVTEPAGLLEVEIPSLDSPILLTGPSVFVGEGTFVYEPDKKNRR